MLASRGHNDRLSRIEIQSCFRWPGPLIKRSTPLGHQLALGSCGQNTGDIIIARWTEKYRSLIPTTLGRGGRNAVLYRFASGLQEEDVLLGLATALAPTRLGTIPCA
jgi:hypothetical protein